jgi:drug/metabolite transporter (DMT)-like permease
VTRPAAARAPSAHAGGNHPLRGIGLKVASVCIFVVMATCLKAAEGIPAGQLVFYRSLFAIIPVIAWLMWKRQLRVGLKTANPLGHVLRGLIGVGSMGLGFFGLTKLPLPESTAIGYASPLLLVILGALLLKERVFIYRWTAVIVGLAGVGIMLWPRLTLLTHPEGLGAGETVGVLAALGAAFLSAFAMLQVRRLVQTERTETIVLYFFVSASFLSLLTLPFGWVWPNPQQTVLLVSAGIAGGIAQILLTACYRYADLSVIAPFEYTSLLLSLIIGYVIFGDVPTLMMIIGASIVVCSGIFVVLREHYLGLDRIRSREANTP